MTRIVADPRVEDIVQCMLPEEHITDDPHASAYYRVRPESTQVGDGIDDLLFYLHLREEIMVIHAVF